MARFPRLLFRGFAWLAVIASLSGAASVHADEVFEAPEAFLAETFAGAVPEPEVLWLTGERKERAAAILGHGYGTLRIRYWGHGERTAWILEEIGKYQLITAGFVVSDGRIERLAVLVYRESHGWEIRYPFFTGQFQNLSLEADDELSGSVDNISGATLSVNAMKRLARLALYLHSETPYGAP